MAIRGIGCFSPGDVRRRSTADVREAGSEFENRWAKRKLRPTYFAFAQPYDVYVCDSYGGLKDTWYAKKDEEVERVEKKERSRGANSFIRSD